MTAAVYRGHLVHIAGAPVAGDVDASLVSEPDGVLVVDATGRVAFSGAWRDLPAEWAEAPVTETGGVLLPGFVDTHLHFPQTFTTDAFGGGELLEWLEHCVFPAESRLADAAFADAIARAFVARRVAVGTTAAMVFGSAFPVAQEALFSRTLQAGLRVVSGRGIQTVGPASATALLTSEADALALTRDEIDAWHGQDAAGPAADATRALAQVAVVPRFSLSVTPTTLRGLGELYGEARERGVYFHSHLNENNRPGDGEIAAVREVYGTRTYLDTYDGHFMPESAYGGESLLGRRSILAHAVHCEDTELARLAETGSSIAHCPTSQLFLGSGTMPWRRTLAHGVTVALGTDVGAGDEWLIPRVLSDAYKVHMTEPGDDAIALHPAELLFLGTLAGARALDQEHVFGNLDAGKEADFVVVRPQDQPGFADVLAHSGEPGTSAHLFTLLLGMREQAVAQVYVRGRRVVARTA
ncbi:MAG: guanine deaminase [Microbacterium sp.]|uniref:Guanine deaminase n=1 Tax=Microbacterium ginsengisoli TaxID=400772 RepID=A0A0F0LTI1_9MICO|nr:amidohydrolase family protein [Microbacterium ginsengisoli]KJL36034.1 Guanine deaminase [Microbacterium ginsengisoli]MAL07700.1 guanine deaminase [Microbacterium sp.]MBN9208503.1 amidohydrolase family protein [Microbacterium ginsengisoli]HAN26094.1 guanine deaminase [Microbacterium ginsengisoli]